MKNFKIIFFFLILLPRIAFADNLIIPGLRVGKYKTGELSQSFFQEKANMPDIVILSPKTNFILNVFEMDQITMIMAFDHHEPRVTVFAIKTTNPKYRLLSGVKVGDNIREITGVYDAIEEDNGRVICKGIIFEKNDSGFITGITVVYHPAKGIKGGNKQ